MAFTKREKTILVAAIAAVCLLALDFYVLTPLLKTGAAIEANRTRLVAKLDQARTVLTRRRLLAPKWHRMLVDGMQRDPAEAEGQLLRSLRNWSAEAGVKLSSQRPERSAEKSELPEITVHVAGTGSMAAVSRLLYRVETAAIPVRVKMLQLGSQKDGTDDLSLHLRVSTLYCPARTAAPEPAARAQSPAGGAE